MLNRRRELNRRWLFAAVLFGEADLVDHHDVDAMDIYVVGGDGDDDDDDAAV